MWLLECDGDLLQGKKLWLRPGKRYLFGRTASEVEKGQFVIEDKNVSRKHMTIEVAKVPEGKASDPQNRSVVSIEDLGTKQGTFVNGKNIKGERLDLVKDENDIKLGKYKNMLRITWRPIVLGFSFTKAELEQNDALNVVREMLEPLDIKFTQDSNSAKVSHVFSKKRQNPRVLLALISRKYVINQGFLEAVAMAAVPEADENGVETSPLERDFEGNWPDATKYLPPKTDGPGAEQPDEAFAPDERRQAIFDGYTFIFYNKKRYEDLVHVITSANGKALLREVEPGRTDIDDFIRYVKTIAGEQGLGEFEDGSEGRGVVVVRYLPQGEESSEWYLDFYNQVALRLDHRPIEPRDLLPAILDVEPAQLRRPLEVEPTPRESARQDQTSPADDARNDMAMDIDMVPESLVVEESPPPPYRPRGKGTQRRAFKSTFKGFDVGSDDDDDEEEAPATSKPSPSPPAEESQGMFMTQPDEVSSHVQEQQPSAPAAARSQRKRPPPLPDRDVMEELAPTAARIKRMRLEGREDALPTAREPAPPPREPEPEPAQKKGKGKAVAKTTKGRGKGKKKTTEDSGDELLDQFITAGQQEEAQRQRENELLRRQLLEGDIDLGEIRKATAVQPMQIRRREGQIERPSEQDRWDPRWNGLRNFKKFRKQADEEAGAVRAQPRKIVSLKPIKPKEYGLKDEYWLEKPSVQDKGKRARNIQSQSQSATQGRSQPRPNSRGQATVPIELGSDSDEEDGGGGGHDNSSLPDAMNIDAAEPSRSRKGKASSRASRRGPQGQTQTQTQTETQTQTRASTQGKRTASGPPAAAPEKPAKRRATRAARAATQDSDEDEDSDGGGMTFRFGARK